MDHRAARLGGGGISLLPAPPELSEAFMKMCDWAKMAGISGEGKPRGLAAACESGYKAPAFSPEVLFPAVVYVAWWLKGKWGSWQVLTQGYVARTGHWARVKAGGRGQPVWVVLDGRWRLFAQSKLPQASYKGQSHTEVLLPSSPRDNPANTWSHCQAPGLPFLKPIPISSTFSCFSFSPLFS